MSYYYTQYNDSKKQKPAPVQPEVQTQVLCKVDANMVYIGKVKNRVSKIEISEDRIVFNHITNEFVTSKFNIMLPFNEIANIKWCFIMDVFVFVVKPLSESYLKFVTWLKKNPGEHIPEDYIVIHFSERIERVLMSKIRSFAHKANSNIKFCEINCVYAKKLLESAQDIPIKKSSLNSRKSAMKNGSPELIEIDDDQEGKSGEHTEPDVLHKPILKYPPNDPNAIVLYGKDLDCLREGQYLNDNIMNFYIKYCLNQSSEDMWGIDKDIADRVHVFDSLFGVSLFRDNVTKKRRLQVNSQHNYVVLTLEPLSQLYQEILNKWTKDVDIFSKDFLIIPLLKESHWFLCIICHPGNLLLKHTQVSDNNDHMIRKDDKLKTTFILMDSLNNHARYELVYIMISYLQEELRNRHGLEVSQRALEKRDFIDLYPKMPIQKNFYDCGLFVLEFIERFLKNPDRIFEEVRNNSRALQDWFDPESLSTNRAKIRQTILNQLEPGDAKLLEEELFEINLNKNGNIQERSPKNSQSVSMLESNAIQGSLL